jgi:hypothetical protein
VSIGFVEWCVGGTSFFVNIARIRIATVNTLFRSVVGIVGDTAGVVLLLVVPFLVNGAVLTPSSVLVQILVFLSSPVRMAFARSLIGHHFRLFNFVLFRMFLHVAIFGAHDHPLHESIEDKLKSVKIMNESIARCVPELSEDEKLPKVGG